MVHYTHLKLGFVDLPKGGDPARTRMSESKFYR